MEVIIKAKNSRFLEKAINYYIQKQNGRLIYDKEYEEFLETIFDYMWAMCPDNTRKANEELLLLSIESYLD